jgi:hypothetical protein
MSERPLSKLASTDPAVFGVQDEVIGAFVARATR